MKKTVGLLWVFLALLSVLVTVLIFLPANWIGALLESQTGGRFALGEVSGNFWRGSAFLGVAADKNSPLTPLFPGRFSWKISPIILLGQVSVELENQAVLSDAVKINGSLSQWQVSGASIKLPSERLEGLGAPLNTIGPRGNIVLRWGQLQIERRNTGVAIDGSMQLEMSEMASRISSIKPLGSYYMSFQWHGETADFVLSTLKGPMMLEGSGALVNGRLQFMGKAFAEAGQEERLANLLNLLGRRRQEGDKQVIALEYR